MTDRERLIKLFSPFADGTYSGSGVIIDGTKVDDVVDSLLANGVIVPPVEVGQTVWYIKGGYYRKTGLEARPIEVTEINKKWHGKILAWGFIANGTRYRFSSIGKTVFLTKEEAEEKLKEREG